MSRRKGVTEISFGDELGRGFFGRVVAANLSPHGEVAAKVIDCTKAVDRLGTESWKVLKKHLFAEAERLSDATHDNVVRVYSVHYSPSREEVYIVTERCDGTAEDLAR